MSSKETQEQPVCGKIPSSICHQRNRDLILRESLQPAGMVVIHRGGTAGRPGFGERNSSPCEWKADETNTTGVKGYLTSFMVSHVRLVHACDVQGPGRAAQQAPASVLALLVRTPHTCFPNLWSQGQCHQLHLSLNCAFLWTTSAMPSQNLRPEVHLWML